MKGLKLIGALTLLLLTATSWAQSWAEEYDAALSAAARGEWSAAREKFLVSRSADLCMTIAVVLLGTGLGTLEGARGTYHVNNGIADLAGEKDIFGKPWNAVSMAAATAATTTWSGGVWNGSQWTGNAWSGARWGSALWTSTDWTGTAWSGARWGSTTWSNGQWTGARWGGVRWGSGTWTGARWGGARWG